MANYDDSSVFERSVESAAAGLTIASTRREEFDPNHGLFYSPLRYQVVPAPNPKEELPTSDWIFRTFDSFVRTEFSAIPSSVDIQQNVPAESGADLLEIAFSLRDQLEQRLVYRGSLEQIIAQTGEAGLIDRVYSILCSEYFGSHQNRQNLSINELREQVVNLGVGVRLIVPGLPFRDQNSIRTQDFADDVTLAEALFLIRLHCTALALYQVVPTGADVVVVSDGALYAPILGIDEEEAARYFQRVRRLRDRLNLRGTVSVIDFKKVIELYDGNTNLFWSCVDHISSVLLKERRGDRTGVHSALEQGMRWNYNSRSRSRPDSEIIRWLMSGMSEPCGDFDTGLPDREEMRKIAARYAAINLALRWHSVLNVMFPKAVRATMHPKQGQIGLPRLGSCFPWNGVAILDPNAHSPYNVEVHSLAHAKQRGYRLVAREDDHSVKVYYERRR